MNDIISVSVTRDVPVPAVWRYNSPASMAESGIYKRSSVIRRVGRAVECTGLENRQGLTVLVSSNLTLSAIYKISNYSIKTIAYMDPVNHARRCRRIPASMIPDQGKLIQRCLSSS